MANLVLCLSAATSKLLFVSLVSLALKGALWALNLFVLAPLSDPLRRLPGPRAGYWENHFWELMEYVCVRSFPLHLSRRLRKSELQSKPISEDPRYLGKKVRQGLAVPRFRRCRSPQWASTTTRLTRLERNKFDFRLIAFDFRAVGHVLNSPKYEKPWQTQRFLSRLIGQGVFAKEGHEHRWQVRKRFTVDSAVECGVNVLTLVDGRDEYWHPRSTPQR
jgi:hypothetical protein